MRKRKLIASDIILLDPLDCGSTVGYTVRRGRHGVDGDISLSDCNRKIEWFFSNDSGSVEKIDRAIRILQGFRAAFIKATRRKA
jgi:hypothetical protein